MDDSNLIEVDGVCDCNRIPGRQQPTLAHSNEFLANVGGLGQSRVGIVVSSSRHPFSSTSTTATRSTDQRLFAAIPGPLRFRWVQPLEPTHLESEILTLVREHTPKIMMLRLRRSFSVVEEG